MIGFEHAVGLNESHLIHWQQTWQLESETLDAFLTMREAAKQDGIDISIASAYRGFERQLAIWNGKFQGQRPVLDRLNQPLQLSELSPDEQIHAVLLWSALPGLSRHHWGTDIDVYDKTECERRNHTLQLIDIEYASNGPCFELNCWLNKNAETYSFYKPYSEYKQGVAPEAWHLSYQPKANEMAKHIDINELSHVLKARNIYHQSLLIAQLNSIYQRYCVKGVSLP